MHNLKPNCYTMYTSQYLVSEIEKHMGKIDVIEPKKLWNIQNKQIHHIHTDKL